MGISTRGEERRQAMSTMKGFWRWAVAGAAMVVLLGDPASARLINPAGVSTNDPAGIVVYPAIRVDTDDGIDTVVQLTNVEDTLVAVKCFYVNANGHCSNDPRDVCTIATQEEDCDSNGRCIEGWTETDFRFNLTKRQPISWSANEGLPELPNNDIPGRGDPPQFNEGSIPRVPEDPFTGELRCIEVDPSTDAPIDRNDLKGEATVITTIGNDTGIAASFDDANAVGASNIDARKYNAIGIRAIPGAQDGDPNTLNLGGPAAEYVGCPNVYTLNHFFEGANVSTHNFTVDGTVTTDLTVVPCAADFLLQDLNLASATIQFLIFNEFEQRFSTSTKVTCYRTVQLADVDTQPGPAGNQFSIFSIGTQGTLTGQSRLRTVAGPNVDGYDANGILAIIEENWASGTCVNNLGGGSGQEVGVATGTLCRTDSDCGAGETCLGILTTSTTAANVQYQGSREQGDRIVIPIP
jgi:hypothetical protein